MAHRILRDIDLAEDATQQALLSIWRDLPQLRDPARFDAWSYRLLVRACYAEGHRARRWEPNLRLLPADEPMTAGGFSSVVDRDQLERGFRRLSIDHLEEGVTALPDRVLDAVLDQLPTTPQRRSWWSAWRRPLVNNTIRIGLVAAAAVVVALIGYQLVAGPNVGGPGPSPSPAPTPRAFPNAQKPLEPGTYVIRSIAPLEITFTVPGGWERAEVLDFVGPGTDFGGLSFWTVDDLRSDPCQPGSPVLDPPPGATAGDLVTALTSLPGLRWTGTVPSEATLDGHTASRLLLRSDADCPLQLWPTPSDLVAGGAEIELWILDVAGTRLVVMTHLWSDATTLDRAELLEVVSSIQISP